MKIPAKFRLSVILAIHLLASVNFDFDININFIAAVLSRPSPHLAGVARTELPTLPSC
jgi:hypothetical protein